MYRENRGRQEKGKEQEQVGPADLETSQSRSTRIRSLSSQRASTEVKQKVLSGLSDRIVIGREADTEVDTIIGDSLDFLIEQVAKGRLDDASELTAVLASEAPRNNAEIVAEYSVRALAQQMFPGQVLEYDPTPKKIVHKSARSVEASASSTDPDVLSSTSAASNVEAAPPIRARDQNLVNRMGDYFLTNDYFKRLSTGDSEQAKLAENQSEILARLQSPNSEMVLSLCKNFTENFKSLAKQNIKDQQLQPLIQEVLPVFFRAIQAILPANTDTPSKKIISAFMHEVNELADYSLKTTPGAQNYREIWQGLDLTIPTRRKKAGLNPARNTENSASDEDESGGSQDSDEEIDDDDEEEMVASNPTDSFVMHEFDLGQAQREIKQLFLAFTEPDPETEHTPEGWILKIKTSVAAQPQRAQIYLEALSSPQQQDMEIDEEQERQLSAFKTYLNKQALLYAQQIKLTAPIIEEPPEPVPTPVRIATTNTDEPRRRIKDAWSQTLDPETRYNTDPNIFGSGDEQEEEGSSLGTFFYRRLRLATERSPEIIGTDAANNSSKGRDPLDLKREAEKPTGHCITLAVDKIAASWMLRHILLHDVTMARYINEFVRAKVDDLCDKAATTNILLAGLRAAREGETEDATRKRRNFRESYDKLQAEIAQIFYISAYALGLLGIDPNISLSEALTKEERWTSRFVEIIPELAENLAKIAKYYDGRFDEQMPIKMPTRALLVNEDDGDGQLLPREATNASDQDREDSTDSAQSLLFSPAPTYSAPQPYSFYHQTIAYLRSQANWKQQVYSDETTRQALRRRFVTRPMSRVHQMYGTYQDIPADESIGAAAERAEEDNIQLRPGYYYFYHDLLRRIGEHKRKRLPWALAVIFIGGAYGVSKLWQSIITNNYYTSDPVVKALISISSVVKGDTGWQIWVNNQVLEALADIMVGTELDSIIYGVSQCMPPLQAGYEGAPCGLGTGIGQGQNVTYGILTNGFPDFPINFQAYVKSTDHTTYLGECTLTDATGPFEACESLMNGLGRRALENTVSTTWFDGFFDNMQEVGSNFFAELFSNMKNFVEENPEFLFMLVSLLLLTFGVGLGYILLKKWYAYLASNNSNMSYPLDEIHIEASGDEHPSTALLFQSAYDSELAEMQADNRSESLEL